MTQSLNTAGGNWTWPSDDMNMLYCGVREHTIHFSLVSDRAVFVLKMDFRLQPTNIHSEPLKKWQFIFDYNFG